MENDRSSEHGCAPQALLSLGIGVITTAIFHIALSIIEQTPISLEIGLFAYLFQIVLVSIPFLLIAFLNVKRKRVWLVGVGLTAVIWGYVLYDIYSRLGDGSGANIGLGWLVLASPILISAACLFVARKELRK